MINSLLLCSVVLIFCSLVLAVTVAYPNFLHLFWEFSAFAFFCCIFFLTDLTIRKKLSSSYLVMGRWIVIFCDSNSYTARELIIISCWGCGCDSDYVCVCKISFVY